MARPLRIEFPGAIYHVYSRMNGSWREDRQHLYRDERDFKRFIHRLNERVEEFNIRLFMFCLMSNHYHLVLETPMANLSRFIQSLTTAYSVYFNIKYQRHGHVFDGRFKAKLIEGNDYLLRLTRYVHQNPVWVDGWKDCSLKERIHHLRTYRWSSYPGYIGSDPSWDFVREAPILAMMDGRQGEERRLYREFVERDLAGSDVEMQEWLSSPGNSIGSELFLKWLENVQKSELKERKVREDVSFRRVTQPLDHELILATVAEVFNVPQSELRVRNRRGPLRATAAKYLIQYGGCSQRQAADLLGVRTGASVSVQLKRLRELEEESVALQRIHRLLESLLNRYRNDWENRYSGGYRWE